MIPLLSSAEVQLATSSSFDCDDVHPHRSKRQQEQQQQQQQYLPSRDSFVSTDHSICAWTSTTTHTFSTARTGCLEELSPSSSSHSINTINDNININNSSHGFGIRRRHSSVSFQETPDILEVEKLEESDNVVPEDIWYTKEELREIRSQCKQRALETERTDGILERGLEHMIPRGSPRHSQCRRNSMNIVFLEQANDILEHGFLCRTERLADEYRRASEISKRRALSRGCKDAMRAWGDLKSEQAVLSNSTSSIIRNLNE